MPDDSNGVYSLPSGYLAVTGETILASQHNPPLEDIADALTARLSRSGAAPMTGDLNMGSNKIESLAAGTAASDAARVDQLGRFSQLPASGKTDTYTIAADDAGKVVVANKATAITFNLPAAAASTNFVCFVRNIGAGLLTLDPNASETIEGATTLTLATGEAAIIWCNGTLWYAFQALDLGNAAKLDLASQAEAEEGSSSTTLMTPQRTAQAIAALTVKNAFRAHKGGFNQGSISTGSEHKVTFDGEDFDVGSKYDAVSDKWTPAAANVVVGASITITNANVAEGNMLRVMIKKNGTDIADSEVRSATSNVPFTCSVVTVSQADGDDYYEVYVETTGVGDKTIDGTAISTYFFGHAI